MYKDIDKNAKLARTLGVALIVDDMIDAKRRERESQKDRPTAEDQKHRVEQTELGKNLFLTGEEISQTELRALGYFVPVGYNIERRKAYAMKLTEEREKINNPKKGR